MPLYEYQCESCGERFEAIQKFTDEPLTVHEKCGGPVRRLLSAPALQFKGSGWYVNDYAKSGSAPKSNSETSGASDKKSEPATASTASTGSSEAKPAAPKPSA